MANTSEKTVVIDCYHKTKFNFTDEEFELVQSGETPADLRLRITQEIPPLSRGDLICVLDCDDLINGTISTYPSYYSSFSSPSLGGRYRNDGVMIYDGSELRNLYSEVDEYGSVPPDFCYPEFDLGYFLPEIGHNFIVWLSEKVRKTILDKGVFTCEPLDHKHPDITDNSPSIKVEFTFNGRAHKLYFIWDDGDSGDNAHYLNVLRLGLLEETLPFELALFHEKNISDSDRYNLYIYIYSSLWKKNVGSTPPPPPG